MNLTELSLIFLCFIVDSSEKDVFSNNILLSFQNVFTIQQKQWHNILIAIACKKYGDTETGKPKTDVVFNFSKLGYDNKSLTALKTFINKIMKLELTDFC